MSSNEKPDLSRGGTVVYDKAGKLVSFTSPTQTIEEATAAAEAASVARPARAKRKTPAAPTNGASATSDQDDAGEQPPAGTGTEE